MADKKPKKFFVNVGQKLVLAKAPFKFPALGEPDTSKYSTDKCASGVYKVTVLFKKNDPEVKRLTKLFDEIYKKGCEETKKAPKAKDREVLPKRDYFKVDTDKEGNETGYLSLDAKMKAARPDGTLCRPILVDAGKNPIPSGTKIWGGTVGKLSVIADFYNTAGRSGISLKLLGAQILQLVGPSGGPQGSADDFEEEEGYTADTSSSGDDTASDENKKEDDEDEPF